MTPTIAYDRPVNNLIDALSATGHVSHRSYKKTSVTFHHNGGKLSHQGVLDVWKYRPASAHFDSDAQGDIAQYVKVLEYAWAVANTQGNQETISIEMCNLSLSPHWEVGDATWKSAARLAGWLFAHVIGVRPTSKNVFFHHHWYGTSCAGPFMDSIYNRLLAETQAAYDHFTANPTRPPVKTLTVVDKIQLATESGVDNKWGDGTDHRVMNMRAAALAYTRGQHVAFDVHMAQNIIDVKPDGDFGPLSKKALIVWIKDFQRILGTHQTGAWDPATDGALISVRGKYHNRF